jgi:hypothetical protein
MAAALSLWSFTVSMVQFSIRIERLVRSNEPRVSLLFTPLEVLESDLDQMLVTGSLEHWNLM